MFGAAPRKSFALRRLPRFSANENSNIPTAIYESGCRQSSISSGSGRRGSSYNILDGAARLLARLAQLP